MARKKSQANIYKEVAKDAISGKYGRGSTMRRNIYKAGYDWPTVQEHIYKIQK